LKARMALRTVCEAHPRLWAILGGELPRALASSIWDRRITKVSLERSPASRLSRLLEDYRACITFWRHRLHTLVR
jgi:hypothetical protein